MVAFDAPRLPFPSRSHDPTASGTPLARHGGRAAVAPWRNAYSPETSRGTDARPDETRASQFRRFENRAAGGGDSASVL